MKVVCEYCGSYVEADENERCPSCCAELGSAVRAAQAEAQQAEEYERLEDERQAAEEAKESHISEIIKGVASVATAFAAGSAFSGGKGTDPHRRIPEPDRHFAPPANLGAPGTPHHMPPMGAPGSHPGR